MYEPDSVIACERIKQGGGIGQQMLGCVELDDPAVAHDHDSVSIQNRFDPMSDRDRLLSQ